MDCYLSNMGSCSDYFLAVPTLDDDITTFFYIARSGFLGICGFHKFGDELVEDNVAHFF